MKQLRFERRQWSHGLSLRERLGRRLVSWSADVLRRLEREGREAGAEELEEGPAPPDWLPWLPDCTG